MLSDYQIQKIILKRADEIDQLFFCENQRHMNMQQFSEESLRDMPSVMVLIDNVVVGFATSVQLAPDILEIGNMFIHKDHRRKGVGQEIVTEYERQAKELKQWKSIIAVNSDLYEGKKAPSAENFYLKCGYRLLLKTDSTHVLAKEI